jgi:hypothetical protein
MFDQRRRPRGIMTEVVTSLDFNDTVKSRNLMKFRRTYRSVEGLYYGSVRVKTIRAPAFGLDVSAIRHVVSAECDLPVVTVSPSAMLCCVTRSGSVIQPDVDLYC